MREHITFQPRHTQDWPAIAGFVNQQVERYSESRTETATRQAMSIVSAYVSWIYRNNIAPLDEAFNARLIDHYTGLRKRQVKSSTAERERKILREVGGVVTGIERRPSTTSATPTRPYSDREVQQFRTWADLQPQTVRRGCIAVVTLGAGCGLTRAEVLQARGTHIFVDRDGLASIHVQGPRHRTVPAASGWSEDLLELAECGDARLVPVRTESFYHYYDSARGQEQPSPQRLRATWLVNRLNARAPLPALLAAAGLASADGLRRSLPFVESLSQGATLSALRATYFSEVAS